jgi:hypothetical protein
MAAKRLKIAVLDDYQGVAEKHFARFKDDHEIVYFPDTLPPYNGPGTPQLVKDVLVERLEPFNVISMSLDMACPSSKCVHNKSTIIDAETPQVP